MWSTQDTSCITRSVRAKTTVSNPGGILSMVWYRRRIGLVNLECRCYDMTTRADDLAVVLIIFIIGNYGYYL